MSGATVGDDDDQQRLELALEELEVLSRHLADATVTIERLRARLIQLEAREARTLRSRVRRFVDRLLGVPALPPLSAELPPGPPASYGTDGSPGSSGD